MYSREYAVYRCNTLAPSSPQLLTTIKARNYSHAATLAQQLYGGRAYVARLKELQNNE